MSNNNDFADVTLACEDDQQVEAHKVILAGHLRRSALLNYLTVNITSTTLTTALSMSSRQEAAAVGEAMLSCRISPTQVRVFEWTFPGITAT